MYWHKVLRIDRQIREEVFFSQRQWSWQKVTARDNKSLIVMIEGHLAIV